jgi:hypothetical protein
VKRTSKRNSVLRALMLDQFRRSVLAFPDEDVLVGTRVAALKQPKFHSEFQINFSYKFFLTLPNFLLINYKLNFETFLSEIFCSYQNIHTSQLI